jgi:hypothetical protein
MLDKMNRIVRNCILLLYVIIALKCIHCASYKEHLMSNEYMDIEEIIPSTDTIYLKRLFEKHFSEIRNHFVDDEKKQKVGDEIKSIFESYNLRTLEQKFEVKEVVIE